jgi:carbon-monoxide dehydrogenase medium subunit
MLRRFRLEEPNTVKDVSDLLARYGDSAKVYAGGTELLLAMKEGLIQCERLINVKKIPGLDRSRLENGTVHVEMGTIGGNLSFAEPHADPGTLFLVLGAKLIAQKGSSVREIPIESFFVDAYETCLEPDEILIGILLPVPPQSSGTRYVKFGHLERPAVGVALFLAYEGDGDSITNVRLAVGCVGPKSSRVEEAEEVLKGRTFKEASKLIDKAGEIAGRASQAISDLHGSADYKEHIVQVLLKRAFQDLSVRRSHVQREH